MNSMNSNFVKLLLSINSLGNWVTSMWENSFISPKAQVGAGILSRRENFLSCHTPRECVILGWGHSSIALFKREHQLNSGSLLCLSLTVGGHSGCGPPSLLWSDQLSWRQLLRKHSLHPRKPDGARCPYSFTCQPEQPNLIWEETLTWGIPQVKPVCAGLSWLLIDTWGPSPWWAAPFPGLMLLGCIEKLAKHEPASSIPLRFVLVFQLWLPPMMDGDLTVHHCKRNTISWSECFIITIDRKWEKQHQAEASDRHLPRESNLAV